MVAREAQMSENTIGCSWLASSKCRLLTYSLQALSPSLMPFTSQAALYALQSTSPMDCDLVNKCLDLIHALQGAGATVHFTWIPSHVGIPLIEKADRLAQCALQDDTVDPGTEHTLDYVKSSIKNFVHSSISDQLEFCCHRGSGTSLHYARVSQSCAYTYGRDTLDHTTGWQ
ncbi:hypothetical protein E2C01_028245 [Portunus trituberculatus]|uniref:RNase H type-1 domain-containing protein n=1 Tax=Portunus trituberculatus TaxID=210409 RepID=A0A5B7EPI0_PORTR|nr:hypothetical protein [Portunus trituberculatus]